MNSGLTVSGLQSPDIYHDRTLVLNFLAEQLRYGRLGLVLGAGASMGYGLPNWDELVRRMAESVGLPIRSGDTNEQTAEVILAQLGGDRDRFAALVHHAMYEGVDLSLTGLDAQPLLRALGTMCLGSIRGQVRDAISFNFDDLLQLYLEYHGFVIRGICDYPAWTETSDLSVFHPHGRLGSTSSAESSKGVVFCQSDYDAIVGKAHLPWRQQLLTIMRSKTCVFIGLSGRDPNLTSLLSEANEMHPGRARGDYYWGVRFCTAGDKHPIWEKHRVFELALDDYEQLPGALLSICQRARSLAAGME